MRAKFSSEQPNVKTVDYGGKIYIFICLNGQWSSTTTEEGINKFWECDYNEIVTTPDKIDVEDVKTNPDKYLNWSEVHKTQEERISELETQNEMLVNCILELSEVLYQ